ncbi:MAG: MBL fold metallo-hydrolase [Deltaproteobacteria bacterium]
MIRKTENKYWIKFLGTAGARFVMIRQLRASGGLWIRAGEENVLVDPGPGSLVRCAASRPRLDPMKLNAIILTHRHLDHSNDINVMVEAMTEGGFKKRGIVFVPQDAIDHDPVLLRYAQEYAGKVEILRGETEYEVGSFSFRTTPRLRHPGETYGLRFMLNGTEVSLVCDTEYFDLLPSYFGSDVLIVNVVFAEPRPGVQHLSLADVKKLIEARQPQKTILTHFGMTMVRARPHECARRLAWETGRDVAAATDGMTQVF